MSGTGLRRRLAGVALAVAAAAACGSSVDLTEALEVTDVTTGWYDAGIVEQTKNKLVPTVTLRLHNVGDERLGPLQLNAVFRRTGEDEEWSSAFRSGIGRDGGLPPGDRTESVVLRSEMGYTGEQPRAEMLAHQDFIDAEVQIFVKYGSAQWVLVAQYPIERQLLTH